jgi:hypothetical protein
MRSAAMTERRAEPYWPLTAGALRAIAIDPASWAGSVPEPGDPEAQFRLGVSDATRVNQAVAYAVRHRLPQLLAAGEQPRSRLSDRLRRVAGDEEAFTAARQLYESALDRELDAPTIRGDYGAVGGPRWMACAGRGPCGGQAVTDRRGFIEALELLRSARGLMMFA